MSTTKARLWEECLDIISQRVSSSQYKGFFEPVAFRNFDEKTQLLVLQVPSREHARYLEESFVHLLREVLGQKFGQNIKVKYYIPTATQEQVADGSDSDDPEGGEPIATHLNPRYTFTTFVEGDANRLARGVGMFVAEHPRSSKFNPMFVYGPPGCGKTHLINAIGMQTCQLYPRKKVLYVSSREFQQQFTEATRRNEQNDFLHFYQQFDMLIVDDVQEWETAPGTTTIFFHIFNHLFLNGRRIILAADRTPSELKNMDERMLSRFSCGMVAEMTRPNLQLCIDILNAKIRRDGLNIPKDVVKYIAQNANGSIRELEGVINSLLAHSIFANGDIDMTLAESVIAKIRKEQPSKVDVNRILDVVCEYYKVSSEDLLGTSRKREFAIARQVCMYLAMHVAKLKTTRIGRIMGGRDHSTVNHSIHKIEELIEKNKEFAREIKHIQKELKK